MSSPLRQFQILVIILATWLMPRQVYSYRGASFSSDGNANAAWRVETDSNDYGRRRENAKQRFSNRRQMLEEGIQKHRRGVENAVNGAREDPQKLLRQPPIELDPVQGMINALRRDKPITLGYDQGDRVLAADLNILPQSMAPRTPGLVDEKIKLEDPNAQTAVFVILPSEVPNPAGFLTTLSIEAASKASCLIFQPDACEYDPLSTNPELTIPEDAIPFEIPGPGKVEIELVDFLVDPRLPYIIVVSLIESDYYTAIMRKSEDVQRPLVHHGPVNDALNIVADVFISNHKIGSDTYSKHLPLVKQQLQVVPSIHMYFKYLDLAGDMMHMVENANREQFVIMYNENSIKNSAYRLLNSYTKSYHFAAERQAIVKQHIEPYSTRFADGN